MFIMRMVAPEKLIIKRLRIKDKKRLEESPEDIERWFKEYREFNKKVDSDFIFRGNRDLKNLYSKLDKFLS